MSIAGSASDSIAIRDTGNPLGQSSLWPQPLFGRIRQGSDNVVAVMARQSNEVGTSEMSSMFDTCRLALRMSVRRGRLEVIAASQNDEIGRVEMWRGGFR